MRSEGTKNHVIIGMAMMVGILAALVMSTVVPQSALSQFASPSGTNQSQSAEINIPRNESVAEPGPKGDDLFKKDCWYNGQRFSPGSAAEMPMPRGQGASQVRVCGADGVWYA